MPRSPRYDEERKAAKKCTTLEIKTKVPSKWRFVDLETGEVWKYQPHDGMQFSKSSIDDVLNNLPINDSDLKALNVKC